MTNAPSETIATSTENTSSPASLTTHVDSSEIEIDPATHLPFLKGVNFSDFNISPS